MQTNLLVSGPIVGGGGQDCGAAAATDIAAVPVLFRRRNVTAQATISRQSVPDYAMKGSPDSYQEKNKRKVSR